MLESFLFGLPRVVASSNPWAEISKRLWRLRNTVWFSGLVQRLGSAGWFCSHRDLIVGPAPHIVDVLDVAGGAVWFRIGGAVTGGAGGARRQAVERVEGAVATVTGQAAFGVSFDTRDNFYSLIV